ncbi:MULTISPECIES: flagellar biosynthesis repressor FlbT [unclassified Azospirillum]|uniref:flagellar biosynthesis repressor FlbT n=1 Tax=unclassified Azospirillum TaxID=2630922 RepID=UPI000B65F838|nr:MULTISPECIES: flagellar biosynthesis repressor FlbT [unclassified Azospirillum]SNS72902.1 flagellar protein FlbT [Azospirillum sp. RU38E]SNS90746.1 flagellar protein FlbT [Azospirillum sp. RU37A]
MGLKLKLKPFEKFIVNGVVIENGRHRNTVTVANHAQVMTGRSILQPQDAVTPVKRTYYTIQAMLLDPQHAAQQLPLYATFITQLRLAIRDPEMTHHLADADRHVREGDFYKALAALRPVIAYEDMLLPPSMVAAPVEPPSEAAVGA